MFLSLEDKNDYTPMGLCHKVKCMRCLMLMDFLSGTSLYGHLGVPNIKIN